VEIRKIRRWRKVALIIGGIAVSVAIGVPFLLRSRSFNEFVDRHGIALMAEVAARGGPAAARARALPYATAAQLEALTRPPSTPLAVSVEPMRRYRSKDTTLTQEVLTFPSTIRLDHGESNTARVYVYRHDSLGRRPVVLWMTGQYTSDVAMVPISWLIEKATARGADVVMLVPPYHLDRSPPGFVSGDAVLATSLADHMNSYAQGLADLRVIVRWLRGQGVSTLGGFGGSAGAMLLLRMVTWERSLDFLTLFNPMLRIGDVLNRPDAAPACARLQADGHRLEEVQRVYASLDSTGDKPALDPGRLSVLYGRFDQLALESTTRAWTTRWNISRVVPHDCGHSLALLEREMYRDYAAQLDQDLRALGH
jgi:hypothetical protein